VGLPPDASSTGQEPLAAGCSESAWRRADPGAIEVESLGDGLAIFFRVSGETHILDAFPAHLFELLRSADASVPEEHLVERVAAMLGDTVAEWRQPVHESLTEMALLSLVERAPSC